MNRPRSNSLAAGALWASAFVLAGLIVAQLADARRTGPGDAMAGLVAGVGDLTVMTSRVQVGEDVVTVLDQRSGTLFVYGMSNRRELELFQVVPVDRLFENARSGGTRRRGR